MRRINLLVHALNEARCNKTHTALLTLSCALSSPFAPRFIATALAASYMQTPCGESPKKAGDAGASSRALDHGSGEYRGIMSLCRLLPKGSQVSVVGI